MLEAGAGTVYDHTGALEAEKCIGKLFFSIFLLVTFYRIFKRFYRIFRILDIF